MLLKSSHFQMTRYDVMQIVLLYIVEFSHFCELKGIARDRPGLGMSQKRNKIEHCNI